jgi:hypothetical protein
MLIRRIKSIGCWNPNTYSNKIKRDDYSTPGDTIGDLKTDKNGLSVWSTSDLEEAHIKPLLAAMALGRDSIQKMCYVALDEERLKSIGIETAQVEGLAPGVCDQEILNSHHDLTFIDYKRMGLLAKYIEDLVRNNEAKTVNEKKLEEYIRELIEDGRIITDNLKDGIKEKILNSNSV